MSDKMPNGQTLVASHLARQRSLRFQRASVAEHALDHARVLCECCSHRWRVDHTRPRRARACVHACERGVSMEHRKESVASLGASGSNRSSTNLHRNGTQAAKAAVAQSCSLQPSYPRLRPVVVSSDPPSSRWPEAWCLGSDPPSSRWPKAKHVWVIAHRPWLSNRRSSGVRG